MQWRHEYVDKSEPVLYQYNPLFSRFPVLISNHLAIILQQCSLGYSEPCETSKMESLATIVMRTNSIPLKTYSFLNGFRGRWECRG